MNLLLDTHTLLWWDEQPELLGDAARAAIREQRNAVFVSAVSVWEIAIKHKQGRLRFSGSPAAMIARNGFLPLPILPEHAERAGNLPLLHSDPFDRMLIAQAQTEGMTLVTVDQKIRLYTVAQLWARA
ncbi:MAG TPA: type II toxin-antitoxin system VapC family toxin [Stellaceae bacterium]|nr:type II toxin-antitoxin system VapC family toxin [Stellaceae bacterium]